MVSPFKGCKRNNPGTAALVINRMEVDYDCDNDGFVHQDQSQLTAAGNGFGVQGGPRNGCGNKK